MKQILSPDHIPVNNYDLIIPGGPLLIRFTEVSGFEEELDKVELPDRTFASGGNTKAFEFTAMHPKHHLAEDAFLESWFKLSVEGIPGYKRTGTLMVKSVSGIQVRTYTTIGIFPFKRKTADLSMENEGELNVTEWSFSVDDLIVI